jgi:hypothetical protein
MGGRQKKGDSQIAREINITSILHRQMIAQKLEGYNVKQTLQTVHSFWYTNSLCISRDAVVTLVAEDNRLCFAGSNLGKCRLNLGVQRILGHNNDNRHVLVDQGKRAVLELSGKDP